MHNLSTNLGIYYQFTWTRTRKRTPHQSSVALAGLPARTTPACDSSGPTSSQEGSLLPASIPGAQVQAGGDNVRKDHAYCARERHDP